MLRWWLTAVVLAGPVPAAARPTVSLVETSASQSEPSRQSTVNTDAAAASPSVAVTVNINRNGTAGAATNEYPEPSASPNNLAALTTRLEGLLKRVRPAALPQPPPQLPRYLVEERSAPPQYGNLSELTEGLRGAVAELDKTHEGVAELLRRPAPPATADLDAAGKAVAVAAGTAAAAAVAAESNLTSVHARLDEMSRLLRRLDHLRLKQAPLAEDAAGSNNGTNAGTNAADETLGAISRDLDGLRAAAANLSGAQGALTDLASQIASETRRIVNQSQQPATQPAGAVGYEALSAVTDSLARLAAEGVASSQQRAAEADGLARISNISASEIMISQSEIVAELAEIQREVAALRASEKARSSPEPSPAGSAPSATLQELREVLSPAISEILSPAISEILSPVRRELQQVRNPNPSPGPSPSPNPDPNPSPKPDPNPRRSPSPDPHPSPNPHQVLNASRAAQQQQQQPALTRRLLTEHEELQDRMDELLSLLRSLATPPPVALPAPQPLQLEQLEQVRGRGRVRVRVRGRGRVGGRGKGRG